MTIPEWQSRTELLMGKDVLLKLKNMHICVVGLGGVGAYTAELLCRSGIGKLTIADGDSVHPSNLNRQLIAKRSTLGRQKAELMTQRLKDINPEVELITINEFLREEDMVKLLETPFDYIVDAIDTLSPKISLISAALAKAYPLVSSMGAGGKFDPLQVTITDISKTYNCRLAHILRKRLHRQGIYSGFKVVFSPEAVSMDAVELIENEENKRSTVGTISYMPAVFGCIMASVVIRELTGMLSDDENFKPKTVKIRHKKSDLSE